VFQFLQDLYSGKLHREFHYGPDTPSGDSQPAQDAGNNQVLIPSISFVSKLSNIFLRGLGKNFAPTL
jgi:hypothetical protein